MNHSSARTSLSPTSIPGEVWVLANWSAKRIFVRWYHREDDVVNLFDSAIALGDEEEQVASFLLDVPNVADPVDVRERAVAAVKSGQFTAIRSYSPSK